MYGNSCSQVLIKLPKKISRLYFPGITKYKYCKQNISGQVLASSMF
jgi:hypothetical protein